MIAKTPMKTNVAVIIPNWNGKDRLKACLDAAFGQTLKPTVIVVENGSTDGSLDFIRDNYPETELVVHKKNLGFAGGVNSGIKRAKELGSSYVALLNNDAVPDKDWLKELVRTLESDDKLAAAASLILSGDHNKIDSTGDFYTTWGLPFNRDRDLPSDKVSRGSGLVFGPSAGAAMYRIAALEDVGMFDEAFFAYHEDADLHFRLQLYGWKTMYQPSAVVSHAKGSTSSKIKGFTTYQTFKNLPLLLWKNVPARLLPGIFIRFHTAYFLLYFNSVLKGRGWPATKGFLRMLALLPGALMKRRKIQKNRRVTVKYIDSILVHDLPPTATSLRRLLFFRKNS